MQSVYKSTDFTMLSICLYFLQCLVTLLKSKISHRVQFKENRGQVRVIQFHAAAPFASSISK